MNKLNIFCVTDKRILCLENFKYNLAGVGKNSFPSSYIQSNNKDNIFYKEKNYSELTFHYWFWKNQLNLYDNDEWIGFCQKRRFWIKKKSKGQKINKFNFEKHFITSADDSWKDYEAIICEPISVDNVKTMKLIKRGFRSILRDPSIIFDKKKKTVLLHFDMHHGYGNMEKAISVMPEKYKSEFLNFVKKSTSFSPNIMFVSKPEIINKWFSDLFDWLFKCEEIFGFDGLKGYDTGRLYAYLAERFLPFWFQKNTRYLEWPWLFIDLNEK